MPARAGIDESIHVSLAGTGYSACSLEYLNGAFKLSGKGKFAIGERCYHKRLFRGLAVVRRPTRAHNPIPEPFP